MLAVFDMSYFGKFYLVGPEARKAADWLFTADVSKSPGTASTLLFQLQDASFIDVSAELGTKNTPCKIISLIKTYVV